MTSQPSDRTEIPFAVRHLVGGLLAEAFTHRELVGFFLEADAPGETPEAANKAAMCMNWLHRCAHTQGVDPFAVLGKVIEPIMEAETTRGVEWDQKARAKLAKTLGKYGLAYQPGGRIFGASLSIPSRSLSDILRERDMGAVATEFQRALSSVETDPPAALTAACAILEAFCKVYIEDEGLQMPSKQTVKPLWSVVQEHLGLDPTKMSDPELKPILGGLSAIVDGIGSWRTHKGSAHGAGPKSYRAEARHARLAAHAAHTLVAFALETWNARKRP